MKISKSNLTFIIFFAFFLIAGIMGYNYDYHDTYLLSLNGRVNNIRKNIKESMIITVSGKEHNIAHDWPMLQKKIEVGDSVFKQPKDPTIILIKANSKIKIVCNYKD